MRIKIPLYPPLIKGGFVTIAISIILLGTTPFHAQITPWVKYPGNPVMTKDTTLDGIWEWAGIGQPTCIVEHDSIWMYYAAAGVAYIGDSIVRGRISFAKSYDGTSWIKRDPPAPVLDVGAPGTWDGRWLDTPAIVKCPGGYKLYYYGDSQSVAFSAIGMASSTDGINFTKHPANPVLEKGAVAGFDGFWVESPAVLYDSVAGQYEMWYSGVGYGPGLPSGTHVSVGRATSIDGSVWIKDSLHNPVLDIGPAGAFDDGWVAVPAVRKTFGQYEMWYIGASCSDYNADSTLDTSRVGLATSPDGIHWTKYAGNPVLSTYDPPVDSGGPWAPDVVFHPYHYAMLYEAIGGIFLATKVVGIAEKFESKVKDPIRIFPNPFSRSTTIRWDNSGSETAEAGIYNSAGIKVKSLNLGQRKTDIWRGDDDARHTVPAGIYFIRITIGSQTRSTAIVRLID